MSEQKKRSQRHEQEDAAFNKMLIWLAGCVGVEILTLLVRRAYLHNSLSGAGLALLTGMSRFFMVFRFLGIVLTAAGIVWICMSIKQKKKGKELILPLACTGVAAWLWIVSVLCFDFSFASNVGMGLLCALPAVIAALAIVFFLYQREFFYQSILCAAGITAIWVYHEIYMNHPTMTLAGFAMVWLVLIAAAVLAYMLKQKDGMLKEVRVLPTGTNYVVVWLTCAVTALLMLVTMLVGVGFAFYVMFALIGWLFCLAVYYTVKLM